MQKVHEGFEHDAQRVRTKWTRSTRGTCGKAQALVLSGSTKVAHGLTSEVSTSVRAVIE